MILALMAAAALTSDPCALVSKSDAASVVGAAPTHMTASGPEVDPDTKASVVACMMTGQPVVLLVAVETFDAPAGALKATTPEAIRAATDDAATVEREAGVGDQAFWAHYDSGARLVVIRGARVLTLAVSGPDMTDAKQKRAPLKALALKTLPKL